jgi:hypothetical protein
LVFLVLYITSLTPNQAGGIHFDLFDENTGGQQPLGHWPISDQRIHLDPVPV